MEMPVVERTVVVSSPQGLHARPADLLVRLAMKFDSEIEVIRDNQCGDAKSMLYLMTLCAEQGTELTFRARGADAEEALDAIVQLVESDFATDDTLSQGSAS